MAKGTKKEQTTVRRIKATDDTPKKKKTTTKKANTTKPAVASTARATTPKAKTKRANPLAALLGYFKGSWAELKLVRWPTRANTWIMTGAVIAFTLLLTTLILLLDAGFNWAFEQLFRS